MLTAAAATGVTLAFGLHDPDRAAMTGPVARGEQGQVWRLETGGAAYAVKEPFFGSLSADAQAEAQADADYQDAVRAAGVPMPGVVRDPDGRVLLEVDGSAVRVYDWVDVLPRDRRLDPARVGRLVAGIHAVVVPVAEPPPPMEDWYVAPVGAERWHQLVDELHRAAAPFTGDLERLVPDILAVEAELRPVRATQWCHLDLWADNVVPTPGGGLVALDWENSGPGDPAQELGVVLFDFGMGDPERIAALYSAYVDAGGPGRISDASDLTVVAAQLGHIAEMGCRRWLASTSDQERTHNEGWVREFIDDPLTLREVEQIVATVSSPRRT